MAETSLQNAGRAIATADRYQVNISIDAIGLTKENATIPKKRPTLNGVGPIAFEPARRIACDCSQSITEIHNANKSEPNNIGRKSRIWPNAMARTIKERDQHCAWPGCTRSHHLHIHHIKHWADGGETSVNNGVCLCAYHHTLVHEGGYTIRHAEAEVVHANEQFVRQQLNGDINQFDFEKSLRNDRNSFNTVRKLLPNRFRYQILDKNGQVITGRSKNYSQNHNRDHSNAKPPESTRVASQGSTLKYTDPHSTFQCREAPPEKYHAKKIPFHTCSQAPAFTYEPPPHYGVNA